MAAQISASGRPLTSTYLGSNHPPTLPCLNDHDTLLYLERINLPPSTLSLSPSIELLSTLLMHHSLAVPYDSSSLHVTNEDWNSAESKPIILGGGVGMELGKGNFDRIVKQRRGGYCYGQNTTMTAALRSFGFQVSEVGARVFSHRGLDPTKVGWAWTGLTHETLVVDWDTSEGKRYLIDVGFGGGGNPFPMLLKDGSTSRSLSPNESFLLRAEILPGGANGEQYPGYTFYRRVLPANGIIASPETADAGPGHWSPCYHFTLSTLSPLDIIMSNFYNEKAPEAPFVNFFVVSKLLTSGARKSLIFGLFGGNATKGLGDTPTAKLYTKEGLMGEEKDVRSRLRRPRFERF